MAVPASDRHPPGFLPCFAKGADTAGSSAAEVAKDVLSLPAVTARLCSQPELTGVLRLGGSPARKGESHLGRAQVVVPRHLRKDFTALRFCLPFSA